ncbi:MAG: ABC transporter permease [Chitinophagaceae bacterium]|nr:ABC transporter permease [Chitinophagaceae bacterium]
MLRNYLKVAFRYLHRYKGYTAINILGLAVGITCCILIMLFVRSEFSYNKFHSKAGRIYRASQHEKYEGQDFVNTVTPLSMAAVMQETYPEIESTCRVFAFTRLVKVDQSSFSEDIRMVDSAFFRQFDFELQEGSRQNPFPTPNSVILTEETAKKFFGKTNPLGKQVEIELGTEKILFTVSGISKKAPEESSIKYKLLIPYSNAKFLFGPGAFSSWFNVQSETFVLLKENVKAAELEKKFPAMVKAQLGEDYREGGFIVKLQPITAIHLDTSLPAGNEPISNPKYSYILATIGILLLLVACINFITLSVGRSATRAMEVGLRKVLGAERKQLIRQFWGEAFLLTIISVIIGLGLAALLVNPFNQLISRNLSLHFDFTFLLFSLLMIGIIAMIAGIYPAIILSGFKPVEVLKGKLKMKSNTGWLRQSLVVGQFVASIAMIVCTIVISEQMHYLQNKELGYNKEQVVTVPTNKRRAEGMPLANLYRTELLKHPEVADAAVSLYSFSETPWIEMGFTDEKRIYRSFQFNAIDPHFIKAMKIEMAQGRSFAADNPADITSAALVNEAFVKEFGLTDFIGKKLPGPFDQQVIGVVKDFNYMSLHNKVRPLLMVVQPDSVFRRTENISFAFPPQARISVRLKAGNLSNNIAVLKKVWKSVAINQDFEYQFLDDTIAAQYQAEQRTSNIVKIASALSIFIACMGLFGLATLAVTRRTKEIGIRKVLGANVSSIVGLLSKDFAKLIIIAAIIAFPLAWWFMKDWLKDFAYRINISWWSFVLAAVVVLLVALLTVSIQSLKAALMNPVKSLRTE